jgi:hypothetical protein
MKMDNKTLLQKADLALSDLAGDGGLLNPEQASSFIRKLIVQPTLMNSVRVVGMGAPTRKINKVGFGSRILHAATSGVAQSSGNRSKPTTEQVTLTAHEVQATVYLPYDVIEDNIERAQAANNEGSNSGPGGFRQTIIELIAERAATDLEESGLLSDTLSGDADLALQDGYLKIASTLGNGVDHASATIDKTLFKAGKKAMPKEYLRNSRRMKHYVSVDQETEYRDTLADRATALGDKMVEGSTTAMAYGAEIVPIPLMPDAQGLYTDPLNLIFGVYRDISMEYDKDIEARIYKIVLTARIAYQIEESDALVHYSNVAL